MGMTEEDLEKSDRAKYGDKKTDIIAQAYAMGKNYGDVYCGLNVRRYIDRFIRPGSKKSENTIDLIKAKSYIDRMIEMNKKGNQEEVIER